jgi:hypothetical protein
MILAVGLLVAGYMRLRRLLEPLEAAAAGVAPLPSPTPPADDEES